MTKPKYLLFVNNIETVLTNFDKDKIKSAIGDSTNNNRTLTVSQLIRFLTTRRKPAFIKLGRQLSTVYNNPAIRSALLGARSVNFRTDALDINELINLVVVKNSPVARSVSQTLLAA